MKPVNLEVLYEDNHILVVNKPAGLLTQPSGTSQDSLELQCKQWIKEKYNKPGNVFLHAVHRLDRPVSGIVLFARTSKALSRLNDSIRSKDAHKVYLALVNGCPSPNEGGLEHYLVHDDHHAMVVSKDHPEGKIARLHYKVIERKGDKSLLEIVLETGRYHQIRQQLAAIGCPIVGDVKYGSKTNLPDGAIALMHYKLEIKHPVSSELMLFQITNASAALTL